MHSRIFQISTEPVHKDDYIDESCFYDHWFLGSVADYVAETDDRDQDIKWLKDCAKGYVVDSDEHGHYIMVTNKEEYFKNAFDKFKSALDEVKDCTIEDFSKGISEIWTIKDAYEDEFGFYVYTDDPIPFDNFVRRAELNQKLYIGATIDYHF